MDHVKKPIYKAKARIIKNKFEKITILILMAIYVLYHLYEYSIKKEQITRIGGIQLLFFSTLNFCLYRWIDKEYYPTIYFLYLHVALMILINLNRSFIYIYSICAIYISIKGLIMFNAYLRKKRKEYFKPLRQFDKAYTSQDSLNE
jgi:hypothetical protein